jgi:hypothetical protein
VLLCATSNRPGQRWSGFDTRHFDRERVEESPAQVELATTRPDFPLLGGQVVDKVARPTSAST